MVELPTLPEADRADMLRLEQIEGEITARFAEFDDVAAINQWHAQAMSLETILRRRHSGISGPLLACMRLLEARIGKLLVDTHYQHPEASKLPRADRWRSQVLARGLGILAGAEWRHTQKELLALILERGPNKKHRFVPGVVVRNGITAKSRKTRIAEILELTEAGNTPPQIADALGISVLQVRRIAHMENIKIHAATHGGKTRRVDPRRVLEESILGIAAYVEGLSMLDGVQLPTIEQPTLDEWSEALKLSIVGLKKLWKRVGAQHERSRETAV